MTQGRAGRGLPSLGALIGRDIARNTLIGSGYLFARLVLQAVYLVLATRFLSAAGYGQLAAVTALAVIVSPLAGLGFGQLMVPHVARNRALFGARWGAARRATAATGALLALMMVPLCMLLLPQAGLVLILALCVSELVFAPLVSAATLAFQSCDRHRSANAQGTALSLARVVLVGAALAAVPDPTPQRFAIVHLAATALVALAVLVQVRLQLGPAERWPEWRGGLRESLGYAFSGAFGLTYVEVDKPLLARLAGAEVAGLFAAAFRLASAALAPITALVLAASPTLFRDASPQRALRLLLAAVGYGIAAAVAIVPLAGLLPLLLGSGFSAAVPLLQALGAWLVLGSARQVGFTVLTTLGRQRTRMALEGVGAGLGIGLNLLLIPIWGAMGTVAALLLIEAALGIAAWRMVFRPAAAKA